LESPSVENRDQSSPGERKETVSSESDNPEEKRRMFFETKSLAEVYAQQGHVSVALEIYRRMQKRNPSDQQLERRISELESGFRSRRPAKPKDQKEQKLEED
jgi:pentatricopeptide repeat protein